MDQLFSHLFNNITNYISYQDEQNYIINQWKCKKYTTELCIQLRKYRQDVLPSPRIEDIIRYSFKPCEPTCPYHISLEDAKPLLVYTIREYGRILLCKELYGLALIHITEGRYPSELELLLFQQVMEPYPYYDERKQDVPQRRELQLQPYKLSKTVTDSCCICQDVMIQDQIVITLPCFHTFHSNYKTKENECLGIESWLQKSDECPLCKTKIK